MAQWYAVMRSATGEAVSFGTEVANPLPAGLEAVLIDHQPGGAERWDAATRAIVASPDPLGAKRARLAQLRARGWETLTAAERAEAQGLVFDIGGTP